MHRIIEQAAVLCGMVKTPHPSSHQRDDCTWRISPSPPQERKSLIIEMKREAKPSRRLRMHIALLAFDGLSPTEIARVLFCSRTTVYAVVSRFLREGRAAFDEHGRRGPRPLLGEKASERLEKLLEEDSPTEHGWLRSRWSCELLALQLLRERAAALVSRETLRRALHRLGFRWRRPRPLRTPGINRKAWISGALNFHTGRFHWVSGGRKDGELFVKLLDHLRRTYRCHKELHLATDNDGSHTSKRVRRYVEDSGGRIRLYPLPSWSPESNPVEVVWWSLHEAVSRNHECAGLDDLVELAEGYLEEGQPFRLKLGEVYDRLERPPP